MKMAGNDVLSDVDRAIDTGNEKLTDEALRIYTGGKQDPDGTQFFVTLDDLVGDTKQDVDAICENIPLPPDTELTLKMEVVSVDHEGNFPTDEASILSPISECGAEMKSNPEAGMNQVSQTEIVSTHQSRHDSPQPLYSNGNVKTCDNRTLETTEWSLCETNELTQKGAVIMRFENPLEENVTGDDVHDLGIIEKRNGGLIWKPFRCDVCRKCFKQNRNLLRHKKLHVREKLNKNDVCREVFIKRNSLQKQTEKKQFQCEVCHLYFYHSSRLRIHKEKHAREKSYKSGLSNIDLTANHDSQRHEKTQAREKVYKCDVCGLCFSTNSNLHRHRRIHTGEKLYKCDVCNAGFTDSSCLTSHKRTHTGEKPYRCDICGRCFSQSGHLTGHTKKMHVKENSSIHDIVCAGSAASSDMQVYNRTISEKSPYRCAICGMDFTHRCSLRIHMKRHVRGISHKSGISHNVNISASSDIEKCGRLCRRKRLHTCDVCGKCLSSDSDLHKHRRIHTGKKWFCDVCSTGFTDRSHFLVHMKTHTREKPYRCNICGRCFSQSWNLRGHKRTHTRKKPYRYHISNAGFAKNGDTLKHKRLRPVRTPNKYRCNICGAGFAYSGTFELHKRSMHAGFMAIKNDIAQKKSIPITSKSQKHKTTQTGEERFKCDVCGKCLSTSSSFHRHLRAHTGERLYKCDFCSACFTDSSILRVHKRIHTGEKPYRCKVCGKCFIQSTQLRRHTKRTHGNTKALTDDIDDDSSAESGDKQESEKKDLGLTSYRCTLCNMDFAHKGSFRMHNRNLHAKEKAAGRNVPYLPNHASSDIEQCERIQTDERPYRCDICGGSFKWKCSLQRHKRAHSGDRKWKCHVCGAGFTDSGYLKAHNRKHTGEKPYRCDVCGKYFSQSGNLRMHEKIHKKEKKSYGKERSSQGDGVTAFSERVDKQKNTDTESQKTPYKCDICGRCLSSSSNLYRHVRTHTGEKLHQCNTCGASFTDTGGLKVHKRIHTGEKPYKCDVCGKCFRQIGSLQGHKKLHCREKTSLTEIHDADVSEVGGLQEHKKTDQENTPYKCDICRVVFAGIGWLQKHERDMHGSERRGKSDASDIESLSSSDSQEYEKTKTDEKQYQCNFCGKSFNWKCGLKRHRMKHTGERKWICDVCGATFTDSSSLKVHIRKHTGEKPYMCDVCGKSFSQSGNLQTHKKSHMREKLFIDSVGDRDVREGGDIQEQMETEYKCDICNMVFSHSGSLRTHNKNMHVSETTEKSGVSHVRISVSGEPQEHQRTHTEEKQHQCDFCGKSFNWRCNLERHRKTHTGERKWKCDVCDATFTDSGYLNQHSRKHTGEKPYKCDVCGKSFSQSGNLRSHIKRHSKEKSSTVNVSNGDFSESDDIQEQMETNYKCNTCNVVFAHRGSLLMHNRNVHASETTDKSNTSLVDNPASGGLQENERGHMRERSYQCDICGKFFNWKCSLVRHYKIHTGERNWKCDFCGAGYTDRSYLKAHIRKHTGEKPYQCAFCEKAYSQSGNLRYHEKIMHSNEKPHYSDTWNRTLAESDELHQQNITHPGKMPYTCDICDMSFSHRCSLRIHRKRTHPGDKPYRCDNCGVGFVDRDNLQVHKRTHSGGDPYRCDVCSVEFPDSTSLLEHRLMHTENSPCCCCCCID